MKIAARADALTDSFHDASYAITSLLLDGRTTDETLSGVGINPYAVFVLVSAPGMMHFPRRTFVPSLKPPATLTDASCTPRSANASFRSAGKILPPFAKFLMADHVVENGIGPPSRERARRHR